MTLEQGIEHFAALTPDKVAAVCGAEQITYSQLWQNIQQRADQLRAQGAEPHRPFVYRASQDIDFLLTYCALHLLGAIATPLEASVSDEKLRSTQEKVKAYTYSEDIVDLLFTTGTTGDAKGVMLSERALVTCAENFIYDLHYTPELCYIVSGPLNHIATLFKLHPMFMIGGTVCILDGLKDLKAFYDAFSLPFTKFATFLVPASIRMLMQFSYDLLRAQASRIDFIETGAAPISHNDMKRLAEALPSSRLYNTYGGTEIGAVCTYNFNDGRYMEGCIGRPMHHSSVTVTTDGHVVISGPTIMSGYVGEPEASRLVLQPDGIHSSDLGYVDEDGMIHLTGREGNTINIGGFKVDPSEVESVATAYPGLKDCICIAASHPVIGTVLKLLVVLDDSLSLDKRHLALFLKERLEQYKVPTLYEQVDKVQRTYNGKLDRKFYH